MTGRITVVSCGTGRHDLSICSRERIMKAKILVGGKRLIDFFPEYSGETFILGKDTAEVLPTIIEKVRTGMEVVILASGDGLFHGIGRLVVEHADDDINLEFIPAPTAFQKLFSTLNLPWDNARFFSIHNGQKLPVREILKSEIAIIYAGSQITASGAASMMCEFLPPVCNRQGVIAINLGSDGEEILHGKIGELAKIDVKGLSILLVLPADAENQSPLFPLGLEDDFYKHEDGLITSREIRTVIISMLRLPYHGILWDIGAGSGSVGIEAAAVCPGLEVYAVEKKDFRLQHVSHNAEKMGVVNHFALLGEAPGILTELPSPDRIFIGGGGEGIISILESCIEALVPGGIIVVSAIMIETVSTLMNWRPHLRQNIITLDAAVEKAVSGKYHYLKNKNRINLIEYRKECE